MTNDDLYHFSDDHLYYEIDMCYRAAALLPMTAADNVLNNAVVESYAIHLRNLIEFLYWEPTRDDVNAVHFVKFQVAVVGCAR